MTLQVVRRIAEERDNSQLVPSKPRTELQRIRLHGLYELLIVLRIVLTLNLQTGWIHQDETNSVEVVAGDYFDLQVFKPGCFNETFPTHSMAILHTTIYLPYLLCSYFLSWEHPLGKERIPNARLLLLIPRLVQLALSFLVDFILVRFCILNDCKGDSGGGLEEVVRAALRIKGGVVPKRRRKKRDREKQGDKSSDDDTGRDERRRRRKQRKNAVEKTKNPAEKRENSAEKSENPKEKSVQTTENPAKPPKSSSKPETSTNTEPTIPPTPPPPPPPPPEEVTPTPTNSYSIRLVTLGSSQVMLIFATRTHPCALNIVLFSTLLYLVSASFHAYDEYILLLERYHNTPKADALGKVEYLRKMKASGYRPTNRVHYITLVTVLGIFNDPEFFLAYACIPLFFYMQRGISHRLVGMKYFHLRIFCFMGYFFLFCVPLVVWDSLYYGRVGVWDFVELNLSPESFVVTPVNYFASKESGWRDGWGYGEILGWYLLVFGVLGVMGLVSFVKELYDVVFADWRHKPNMDSHWTFLNCSLFLPLFFLIQAHGTNYSVFDLAPLIFPLVYMHGHKIPLVSRFSSKIGFFWFFSNCLGVAFFGYLSQGGILTSFLDLYDNLTPIRFNDTQVDITFSQMTAIPPTFTLAIPSKWKTLLAPDANANLYANDDQDHEYDLLHKTVLTLEQSSKLRVYHTGHSPLPMAHLERDLYRLVHHPHPQGKTTTTTTSFLLIPHCYGKESQETFKLLKLTHIKTYWNHVFVNLFGEGGGASGGGLWHKNTVNFGLSLYSMEKVGWAEKQRQEKKRGVNDTKTKKGEEQGDKFQWHGGFTDFLKCFGNLATLTLTLGLFLTSYLVYLT